jgi:hypothetical protein
MEIKVNGESVSLESGGTAKLGEILAEADEILESAGAIIIGIKVGGREIDAGDFAAMKDLPGSEAGAVEIIAESVSVIKVKALDTLLELLSLSAEAAVKESCGDWPALANGLRELAEAFSGLFSADELSFVQGFAGLVGRAETMAACSGGRNTVGGELRAEIGQQADGLSILFKERLAEIASPVAEMRKAAELYRGQEAELTELPVLLQTGKDERAMKAVVFFIEIFNKVIRLIPELEHRGLETKEVRIGGEGLSEFYASFNDILRRLSTAFEDTDSILIGDLAEYEVAPRMTEFFKALAAPLDALDASRGDASPNSP